MKHKCKHCESNQVIREIDTMQNYVIYRMVCGHDRLSTIEEHAQRELHRAKLLSQFKRWTGLEEDLL